jgi:hypothetical protein
MPFDPRDKNWVVVLEEASCSDTHRRVSEWRESFDPMHRIPDDEIKIETYRIWTEPDGLRISVRPGRQAASQSTGEVL